MKLSITECNIETHFPGYCFVMKTTIPPAVYPPQDTRLKEAIDEVCRDIIDYGDNGLNCYRNQVLFKSCQWFIGVGECEDVIRIHWTRMWLFLFPFVLSKMFNLDGRRVDTCRCKVCSFTSRCNVALIDQSLFIEANPYLTPDEISTISRLLQELNGIDKIGCWFIASGKSIVKTREMIMPFLYQKGFAVIQMLFNKFNSGTTFTTKLVVLYLINDLLAVSKTQFPGILPCLEPYIEIMISELHLCQDCSINRIAKLIELWLNHSM